MSGAIGMSFSRPWENEVRYFEANPAAADDIPVAESNSQVLLASYNSQVKSFACRSFDEIPRGSNALSIQIHGDFSGCHADTPAIRAGAGGRCNPVQEGRD
jgi:hypothetical protein